MMGGTQTLGWRLKVEVDFAVGDPLWSYVVQNLL